jgi:DNA-binding transcriptional LysR family regulator
MSNPSSGLYWAELRIFLQVAKAKSFNKAARQLGISHPTIGRAVRRLELELNAELLVANARGAALTPVGSQLARALTKLDSEIAEITRRLSGE